MATTTRAARTRKPRAPKKVETVEQAVEVIESSGDITVVETVAQPTPAPRANTADRIKAKIERLARKAVETPAEELFDQTGLAATVYVEVGYFLTVDGQYLCAATTGKPDSERYDLLLVELKDGEGFDLTYMDTFPTWRKALRYAGRLQGFLPEARVIEVGPPKPECDNCGGEPTGVYMDGAGSFRVDGKAFCSLKCAQTFDL